MSRRLADARHGFLNKLNVACRDDLVNISIGRELSLTDCCPQPVQPPQPNEGGRRPAVRSGDQQVANAICRR